MNKKKEQAPEIAESPKTLTVIAVSNTKGEPLIVGVYTNLWIVQGVYAALAKCGFTVVTAEIPLDSYL